MIVAIVAAAVLLRRRLFAFTVYTCQSVRVHVKCVYVKTAAAATDRPPLWRPPGKVACDRLTGATYG